MWRNVSGPQNVSLGESNSAAWSGTILIRDRDQDESRNDKNNGPGDDLGSRLIRLNQSDQSLNWNQKDCERKAECSAQRYAHKPPGYLSKDCSFASDICSQILRVFASSRDGGPKLLENVHAGTRKPGVATYRISESAQELPLEPVYVATLRAVRPYRDFVIVKWIGLGTRMWSRSIGSENHARSAACLALASVVARRAIRAAISDGGFGFVNGTVSMAMSASSVAALGNCQYYDVVAIRASHFHERVAAIPFEKKSISKTGGILQFQHEMYEAERLSMRSVADLPCSEFGLAVISSGDNLCPREAEV